MPIRGQQLSTVVITIVTFFTVAMALYSEFYQAPRDTNSHLSDSRSIFQEGELDHLIGLRFKNRLGEFSLQRSGSEIVDWQLISPRQMPANISPINAILDHLYNLKIRKTFEIDPINTYNFSLDNPTFEIDLKNSEGKLINIRFGLINSLDNSTYVSVSNKNSIYHVDGPAEVLEVIDLPKFMEPRIAPYAQEKIKSMTFYKNGPSGKTILFKAQIADQTNPSNNDNSSGSKSASSGSDGNPGGSDQSDKTNEELSKKTWIDQSNNPLSEESVLQTISELSNLKAMAIFDFQGSNFGELTDKVNNNPFYIFELELAGGEIVELLISELIDRPIPELKLEKRTMFLVSAKHLKFPYVVDKSYFTFFDQINPQRFKKIPVKKLFY